MNSRLQNLSEEVITDWPETKDPLVTTFKSTVKHCQYCHKDTIARVNLVSHVLKRVENCDRVRCKLHSPVLLVPHVRAENSFKKRRIHFEIENEFLTFFYEKSEIPPRAAFLAQYTELIKRKPVHLFRNIVFYLFHLFQNLVF